MYYIVSLIVAFVSTVILFVKIDDIIVLADLGDVSGEAKVILPSVGFLACLVIGAIWPVTLFGACAYGLAYLIKKKLKKGDTE